MKDFWSENSKIIGKLILNQFGATFFGLMLLLSAHSVTSQKEWLMPLASFLSVLFYLYLIYNVLWERGGRDRIKIDGGRAVRKPLTGLWISLIANIPNFIFALLVLVSTPFAKSYEWAGTMNVIGRALCLLWEGMYQGIVVHFSPKNPIIFLLMILPAIFVCTFSYLIGLSNRRLFSFTAKQTKK